MKKVLLLLIFIPSLSFSQSKLSKAKTNLSSSNTTYSKVSSSGNSNSSSSSSSGDFGFFELLFLELFIKPLAYISERAVVGDLQTRYFTPHPYYYDNVNGEYDFGFEKGDKGDLLRLSGNYVTGNIVRSVDLNLNYRFTPIFGAELSHQQYFEKVRDETEFLNSTSLLMNYYRIRERWITGWVGTGVTYVGNEVDSFGFTYKLGMEVYPFKPISFHTSFQQSFVNSSSINTLKLQAKYHIKKTALYTGYHHISLGGVKASGFVVGIEYVF